MSFHTLGLSTPGGDGRHRNEINRYIHQLAAIGYPVTPLEADYSPSTSSPGQNHQCVKLIKFVYFKQQKAPGPDHIANLIEDSRHVPKRLHTLAYLQLLLEFKAKQFINAQTSPFKQVPVGEPRADASEIGSFGSKLRMSEQRPFKEHSPEQEDNDGSDDDFKTAPGSPSPSRRPVSSAREGSPSAKFLRSSTGMTPQKTTTSIALNDISFARSNSAAGFHSLKSSFNPLNQSMRSDTTEMTIPDEEPPALGGAPHIAQSETWSSQQYYDTESVDNAFAAIIPPNPLRGQFRGSSDSSARFSGDTEFLHQADELLRSMEALPTPRVPNIRPGENWKLRNLPERGFFNHVDLPANMPFGILYEYHRVCTENKQRTPYLPPPTPSNDYETFYKGQSSTRCDPKAWGIACIGLSCRDNITISLKGTLNFAKSSSADIFDMTLNPLRLDKSCRFQRKFGGDRFLTVDVPPLYSAPAFTRTALGTIEERFLEWLMAEKKFLLRSWRIVYLEQINDKKKAGTSKPKVQFRATFFAVSGNGIEPFSLDKLLDWFMPLNNESNLRIPYTKAFSRLQLGFSRTDPTLGFSPAEVENIPDTPANGVAESKEFDDPTLDWQKYHKFVTKGAMDDGCAEISMNACKEIWASIGRVDSMPSVFQGRINGAKGVWIRSAASDATDKMHQKNWIKVNDSQRKFEPHIEDLNPIFIHDPERWRFELLSFSKKPKSSFLYLRLVPILVDRGISREAIAEFVLGALDKTRQEVYEAIEDGPSLLDWLQKLRAKPDLESPRASWALPSRRVEKIVKLLQSGFQPKELGACNQELIAEIQLHLSSVIRRMRVELPKSTYILGIADPTHTLQPGEVFLAFSHGFEIDSERISQLKGEIIVARHPALRNSDVQKARAVYRPELSHLSNVIVFPSTGCFPLASKLSGGDYDGDAFWVCWEPSLVMSFHNAPAPMIPREPERFGVRVDKRSLKTIMGIQPGAKPSLVEVERWIGASLKFRLQSSLLGIVTNYYDNVAYALNKITGSELDHLADLHDHLVDYEKQGYSYSEKDFTKWKKTMPGLLSMEVEPAYKQDSAAWLENEQNENRSPAKKAKVIKAPKEKVHTPENTANPLDYIYFDVIKPHVNATIQEIKAQLPQDVRLDDDDLFEPYTEERKNAVLNKMNNEMNQKGDNMNEIKYELDILESAMQKIQNDLNQDLGRGVQYSDAMTTAYESYIGLQPHILHNPTIATWQRSLCGQPSHWDILKASCLAIRLKRSQNKLFNIAGDILCYIKVHKVDSPAMPQVIASNIFSHMRYKRQKQNDDKEMQLFAQPDQDDGDEYGSFELDSEYASIFDEFVSARESIGSH